jgi:hypothetical protein
MFHEVNVEMRKEYPFISIYRVYSVSTDNVFIVILYDLGGYDLLLCVFYVGDGVAVSLQEEGL